MAPASTSQLDSDKMGHEFKDVVRGARMVTTEISQVPLSGVRYLVEAARSQGIPSLLDVDVPPQVALTSARLGRRPLGMGGVDIKVHAMTVFVGWSVCAGSKEDLIRCVTQASVLKLTRSAAGRSSSHIQFTAWGHTLVFHTNPPREYAAFIIITLYPPLCGPCRRALVTIIAHTAGQHARGRHQADRRGHTGSSTTISLRSSFETLRTHLALGLEVDCESDQLRVWMAEPAVRHHGRWARVCAGAREGEQGRTHPCAALCQHHANRRHR